MQVVSAGYCALSFVSFKELVDVAKYDHNNVQSNVLWAVLAASFIGPFVVACAHPISVFCPLQAFSRHIRYPVCICSLSDCTARRCGMLAYLQRTALQVQSGGD